MAKYGSPVRLRLLVTVKAYPVLSDQHGEAVCVAGIRTDTEHPEWVRLFPVAFRRLPREKQFAKYQEISLEAWRSTEDGRPESWLPNLDSLQILGAPLPTSNHWAARRRWVSPLVRPSMCAILREQAETGASLAVFRPGAIKNLKRLPGKLRSSGQAGIAQQIDLFEPSQAALEELPHKFKYTFRCNDEPDCEGHEMSILDWEIGEAYRSWRRTMDEDAVVQAIRNKWLDQVAGANRDLHLFVGNIARYPKSFCVLGTFWPEHDPRGNATLF